ncbi:MAG: DUF86 domain-containing protein [Desulfovibrionaceae bacterium]|nr:DUF86 domain-containing protein [Desulfovibrionaceae bacterium]
MHDANLQIIKLLSDIHASAERVLVMLEAESRESFLNPSSMTVQDAVARRFTIIGEASATLLRKHPEFCQEYPKIPLRQARGMRNFLVHDYDGVDWEWVWDTAKAELPKLIGSIAPFLSEKSR